MSAYSSPLSAGRPGRNKVTKYIGCLVLGNIICIWRRMELTNFLVFESFLETFLERLLCVSGIKK